MSVVVGGLAVESVVVGDGVGAGVDGFGGGREEEEEDEEEDKEDCDERFWEVVGCGFGCEEDICFGGGTVSGWTGFGESVELL